MENEHQIRKGLSQKLKTSREAKKLTQDQVATHFEITKGTVSAWENGRGVPDAIRLGELALLYDIPADALLSLEPAREFTKPVHDLAQALDGLPKEMRERALELCWGVLTLARRGDESIQAEDVTKPDQDDAHPNVRRAQQ